MSQPANDEFSQHLSDDEASNHEEASDTGAAPKQQQQVIPQTTAISNIKLLILKKEEYDIWAMEMEGIPLNLLPPAWSYMAMTMSTEPDVDSLSIDDLYNQPLGFLSWKTKGSKNSFKYLHYFTSTPNIPEKEVLACFTDEVYLLLFCHNQRTRLASCRTEHTEVEETNHALMAISSSSKANEIYEKDEKLKKYNRIGMKALKEKEQLQKTLDSWKDSFKNLWRLINSGMSSSSKIGLGYEIKSNDEVLSYEEEMIISVFNCTEEDSVGKPLYNLDTASTYRTSNSFSPKRPQVNQFNQRRHFSKSYSSVRRPFAKTTAHSHAVNGNWGSAVKTSEDHPLKNMVDRCIFDSGCSGHMTSNKDQLEVFEEFNGGSVTFGELGHLTFFKSQRYVISSQVLFTETECLVVSSDFKMPDENQILLKVPRHHNMYSFDMKTPTPAKGFACLIAKATSDESKLWHRRLGASEVSNSAGTSQTQNSNAFEEKDEDVELIVVPSVVKNTEEKVESRTSSTNSKKQENKASSTDTSEDNPKILALRRELEEIALKHLGTVSENNSTSTPSVNTGSESVNIGRFDPDDSPMPELEIFHKSETGIFDEASYDEEGVITDFNSLPTEIEDKYVAEILKKFDLVNVKTAITPMETKVALTKDEEAVDVDVHLYRSMIDSLVYLKGKPHLGLWYPRESPFDLEAFSDSDYGGSNLDRKSTTGGCQFLGQRLISWQCKKQTIVATSTTEAEYVAAANLWTRFAEIVDFLRGSNLRIDDLEKQLKETKQTFGKAILTLVERVKTLEVALKRKTKRVLLSDSEEEETEAQGRKFHDLDPLVSLLQELVTPSKTPSKTVNASGEEQVEDISPTTLEAAAILTKVKKIKSVDKGKRYKRRKVSKESAGTGLDFEEVKSAFEEVNTGSIKVSTGIESINAGSLDVNTGSDPVTTDSIRVSVPSPDRAKLEANAELRENVLGKDLSVKDYAKRMVELVNQRRKHFAEERARAKRNKHMTQTQLRNYMSNFLKIQGDHGSWTQWVKKLIFRRKEKVEEDKDYKPTKKTGKRRKQIARKGLHTDLDKDDSEDSDEASKKDDSTSGIKIPINPVPVAIKSPSIASYKIIKQGRKGVYQIVRENGSDKVYISFGAMLTDISRDDLTELYMIAMRKHGMNEPEDEFEKVLWEYLKNMFEEPFSTDSIWSLPGAKGLTSPEQTATGKGISNPLMAVMVCPKPYGIQLTNVSSTEIWKLLLRDVAVSFDSAVHRDHAGSFDAAVLSLVYAACCTAAVVSADSLNSIPADYVSAGHVLVPADSDRIC
ncbi:hypothetical protein Tco_1507134 [Tanacetum coccineum]